MGDGSAMQPAGPGQRVQVNGPRWRRVSLALLDVLRRFGPATVVRSCSEMPLFRPGNAPRSAMGSVPIKSVNLNSLPWAVGRDVPRFPFLVDRGVQVWTRTGQETPPRQKGRISVAE